MTTSNLDATDLATTSLDELNAAAGLLTRVDRKYLVPLEQAQAIVDQLAQRARVLEIAGERQFTYASTYFDTPDLDAYLLAAHKRRRRFKVRTRSYVDSGLCFLEVKTRGSRGATVKQRIKYNIADADVLTGEGRNFIMACLMNSGAYTMAEASDIAFALEPVMRTSYKRTTLHLPDDNARATIDTELEWEAIGNQALGTAVEEQLEAGPMAIIETKNPSTPSPTDKLLWSSRHRPAKISKYATGLALLHPELPANKWHRVTNRDLAHVQEQTESITYVAKHAVAA